MGSAGYWVFFCRKAHILMGVGFPEVTYMGGSYADVDDLIFAGEETLPSDR